MYLVLRIPQISKTIRSVLMSHSLEAGYPTAEMLSVYSTASAD